MYPIKYEIWVLNSDGREVLAFHWSKTPASGVAQAWVEASKHDIHILDAWAVPYKEPAKFVDICT